MTDEAKPPAPPNPWTQFFLRLVSQVGTQTAQLRTDLHERKRSRFEEMRQAASFTDEELGAAFKRVGEDERLADMFELAAEAAMRSSLETKRRALGRALRLGLLATDDAQVDASEILMRGLVSLEGSHVRLLERMPKQRPIPHERTQTSARNICAAHRRSRRQRSRTSCLASKESERSKMSQPTTVNQERGKSQPSGCNCSCSCARKTSPASECAHCCLDSIVVPLLLRVRCANSPIRRRLQLLRVRGRRRGTGSDISAPRVLRRSDRTLSRSFALVIEEGIQTSPGHPSLGALTDPGWCCPRCRKQRVARMEDSL